MRAISKTRELQNASEVRSFQGIGPTKDKVRAISKARELQNASEVRSFLGLANYNAWFIPDFATVAEPLRRLTKKGAHFEFSEEQRKAFNELKRRLSSAKTLGYFIIADASPVGLGAILIQEQQGRKRVISYASKSLSDVEKRYSQTEKEVVWHVNVFMCTCMALNLNCTLITSHQRRFTPADQSRVHELNDGSCDYSHTRQV